MLAPHRSPDDQILVELRDLGSRFLANFLQDEYGPTRAEVAASIRVLIGTTEEVVLAIRALRADARKTLSAALGALANVSGNSPPESFYNFEAEKRAMETLLAAATDVSLASPTSAGPDFEAIKRLQRQLSLTTAQLHSLDTTCDTDLSLLFTPKIAGADLPGDDLAHMASATDGLLVRLRRKLDLLSAEKGPNSKTSLPLLVFGLCRFWERETGRPVTANPYKKTKYYGAPQSEAGKFVAAAVAALTPASERLEALMEKMGRKSSPFLEPSLMEETAQKFSPFLKSQLNCSPQTIQNVMQEYVRARRATATKGRAPPR